jgi:hypothetical protein
VTATVDGQESSQASPIPPEAQLAEMLSGLWMWWMLYLVAERGVADLLADGPRTSVELAQATGLHEPSLYRLLRSLRGLQGSRWTSPSSGQLGSSPGMATDACGSDGFGPRSTLIELSCR